MEIYSKVKYYFDKQVEIYIRTHLNRHYRGKIIKCDGESLILNDVILGEIFIDYGEIKILEVNKEGKKDGKKGI